uniref:Uncharacterized protein n=1 Tax=Philodina roseola TaxID=96448 RepID=B2L3J7_PHIRO|nr:unknown [Philodina roseola]
MSRNTQRNFIIIATMMILSLFVFMIFYHSVLMPKSFSRIINGSPSPLRPAERKNLKPFSCPIRGDRWIIVTSIFYPTPSIYKFLNLTTEWNLIVVADRKTPKDWLEYLSIKTSRLIFLSVEEQKTLNFRIIDFLPFGSYARKNLGYLIAIQCGAKIVFESDDDNLLETDDIFHLPKIVRPNDVPWISFHRQRSPFVNIYGSFGHSQIWPRGFPVDELRNVTEDGWHSVRRNDIEEMPAYIQQYLADLDPDVDALFRLTHPLSVGRVHFDRTQPPIAIDQSTFSPYNTQNTITHYEAFWGLYLPVTTTFRVCDIWRGFWVQRLLWDIGGYLIFGTATVRQIRNSHSYLKDMQEEDQLYHQSGSFVRFLASWTSPERTLIRRIALLARDIAQAGFWHSNEINIIDAWLNDLLSVGYKFPSIVSTRPSEKIVREKRAAICVTGVAECLHEGWIPTSIKLRERLTGEIDTFLFISSSMKKGPVPLAERLKQIRSFLNTTVTIIYEDRFVDPQIPDDCQPQFQLPRHVTFPLPAYFQQLWSLNECYDLVKEYEEKFHFDYQLMIRARIDTLGKMPSTFERSNEFNVNRTILVPPHRYFSGIDDGFALGPMKEMSFYMKRWLSFRQCPPDRNFHPETYLRNYLLRFTNFTVDASISGAADAIRHGQKQCH